MRAVIIYLLIAIVAYWFVKTYVLDNTKYVSYLQEIGIPNSVISKMNAEEIKASALYLQRYGRTNLHFTIDDPDYKILSQVRTKYGIFS